MQTFTAYSALHFAALALIAGIIALSILIRRRRSPCAVPVSTAERTVGIVYLAWWIAGFIWLLFPPQHEPPVTYPLQLCHLCAACAALSLITGMRALRAMAYFIGLGLCTQALLTPGLHEGPALPQFWIFWSMHGMIVGVPIYDVVARDFRPGWRDFGIACLTAAAYVALILPIDLAFGWNYGFVGPSSPDVPTIVDLLGPWPQRLIYIVLISALVMALLLAPWRLTARRSLARS